jgi:hypothetical protein
MANNNINNLLRTDDIGISKTSGANGVLSRLWRQILVDLNIREARFGELLQAYVLDPRNAVPNNKRDQISTRGNLNKEFGRPQMTWKVFCKALKFLNIAKIEFVINATHTNGKLTSHSTLVNLGRVITSEVNGDLNVKHFDTLLEQPEHHEYVQPVPYLDNKEVQ